MDANCKDMTIQSANSSSFWIDHLTAADVALLLVCRPHLAVAIAWWRLLGMRVRARNRLETAIGSLPLAHERRMRLLGNDDLRALAAAGGDGPAVAIHIHIPSSADTSKAQRAIASARRQSVSKIRLIVTSSNGECGISPDVRCDFLSTGFATQIRGLAAALDWASKHGITHVVPLDVDAVLPRHACAAYAAALLECAPSIGEETLLYGDEDESGRFGQGVNAWLKPEWDERMILSQDYVSSACALPVIPCLQLIERAEDGGPASLFGLILALTITQQVSVMHVYRRTVRTDPNRWREEAPQQLAAVAQAAGHGAQVHAGAFGTVEVEWPLPDPLPRVSIVVATRDRVELLRCCVDGLLHATDYPALDVIIADNDSVEPETLDYMDAVASDPRVQIVRWPHPFNYSAINNFAAGFARGPLLCLLNNDIEIVEPQWLTELVREAIRPGAGAVGGRLLYPDRSIQHAGVAIGLGNAAGHAHRALPYGKAGYFAQALIARGASAVTGACLLLHKADFDAVGGLDEEGLAVAYNDVDLCLKLQGMGRRNVYVPRATLIHHESKSRGLDFAPEHLARYMAELKVFQERWDSERVVDPWHHPMLDRGSEVYSTSPN